MLTLAREMGLSVADVTRGSGCDFDPTVVDKILALARYNSNRLAHTAGAPLHVSRTRHRDPSESGVDLLASALRAAEHGDFERAHGLVAQAGHIFELTGRKDLLCEVQIAAARIHGMERSSLVRETRMRAEVDATLDEAERRARALSIEGSKALLRQAAALTAVDNFPRRDSLQRRFNGVAAALEAAELVIKGDDQLALAWDCVQRDELTEAQRYLDEAQLAYASTDLRTQELRAVSDALGRKRGDEQRIRMQFRGLVGLAREAIRGEGFVEAALLIEQARDALSQWTNPDGKDLVLVTRLTSMIAKTYQNKPLFEAYCAFDDKNLSGQGNRALMMDFNEYLHLLQDLGVLEQKTHKPKSKGKGSLLKSMAAAASSTRPPPKGVEVDEKQSESVSKGRAFQIELCQHCTYPEIKESAQCKVAKADIYDIFRAVNFRSVLQLHRGNIDADNDMSSLNYLEYHLCMLRLGKLLGVPVTDHGTSPLFLKDLRDLEDLKDFFVEAKLKVRERLLSNGENFVSLSKNAMQECAFADARNQLQLAVAQYQRVDDEQIMRHYLQNCKRLSELIDREEKKEMARKSELVVQAEAALERVKAFLDDFDQTGCRFDESKFKICVAEAVNARKYYKSAQLYGIYQRDNIQKLQSRIVQSEAHILELRAALAKAHLDLQAAEQLMEAYNFADNDALSSMADIRFSRAASFNQFKDPSEEVFQSILTHLENADSAVSLAKDPSTRASHELLMKRYVSYARIWVQNNSQSGLSYLEQARQNFESAVVARNHDWKSAFDYLHKSKKGMELAQKFIFKAMLARCAVPYFDVEDADIFHNQLFAELSLKAEQTEALWKKEKIEECANGVKLLDECKRYIHIGDFGLASEALASARSILKGENSQAVNSMESELESKRLEDEDWTKALISKASKCLRQAITAISSFNAELAYNDCESALEILSQIRSINQKPKAFNLRQEVISSKLNIVEAAFFTFDNTLENCAKALDEGTLLMYELKYQEAENLSSKVGDEIKKLQTGGILRIPGSGKKRALDFEDIQDRLELLKEMLNQRDSVLKHVADFDDQLGKLMVAKVTRCLEEAKYYGKPLSGQELQYVKQLFESGKALLINFDQIMLENLEKELRSCQEQEDIKVKGRLHFVQSQASEANELVLKDRYLEAQVLLSDCSIAKNNDEAILFQGMKDLVFIKTLEFLERAGLEVLGTLKSALLSLAGGDFRKTISILRVSKSALADSRIQEVVFVVSAYSDVQYLKVSNAFRCIESNILKIENELEAHVVVEDEIVRLISAEINQELEKVHASCQNLDFDTAGAFISRAALTLSGLQCSVALLNATTNVRENVRNANSLLIQAQSRWKEETAELTSFDPDTGYSILHKCCLSGNIYRTEQFIRLKPDIINHQDHLGKSALHYAAANGHDKCITLLIHHKAVVDLQDINGCTALVLAIKAGHSSSVRILRQSGAVRTKSDKDGFCAVHHCVLKDRPDLLEEILWGEMSPDSKEQCLTVEKLLEHRDFRGYTPLMLAIIHGNLSAGEALLSSGANPRDKDAEGFNSLHLAAKFGNVDIIPLLHSYLKEIDCPGGISGASALMTACNNGMLNAIKTILDLRGNPNYQDNECRTPMHRVCASTFPDLKAISMLQLLVDSGAEISKRDSFGLSPLGVSCSRDQVEVLDFLLKAKPSSPESNRTLQEAFLVSLFSKKYDVLKFLSQNHKSELSIATTMPGWNILHASILVGDTYAVTLILEMSSANLNVAPLTNLLFTGYVFQEGDTPLVLAKKCISLAKLGKINRSVDDYYQIYDMLRGKFETNSDSSQDDMDPDCPSIILEQIFLVILDQYKSECDLTRADVDTRSKNVLAQEIEFERQELLEKIKDAERRETERVYTRAHQLRFELFRAEQYSLCDASSEAFSTFETASKLVADSGDGYEISLLEKSRDLIQNNLIQHKLLTIEIKEATYFQSGMFDVRSSNIDLSFLGDCWGIFDTNATVLWRSLATENVIAGECRIWLNSLVGQLESKYRTGTIIQSVENCKLHAEKMFLKIGDLCQNLCFHINEETITGGIDFNEGISDVKEDLANLDILIQKAHWSENLESLETITHQRNVLSTEIFILDETSRLTSLLRAALNTQCRANSWYCMKWAEDVLDRSNNKYIEFLRSLRTLLMDRKLVGDIDMDSVKSSLPAGNVINAFDDYLAKCRKCVESVKNDLIENDIKQTMNDLLDSLGSEMRISQLRESKEKTLEFIQLFEKAFLQSDCDSCYCILESGISCVLSALSENQVGDLHRFIVCQSHVAVMKRFQDDAEMSLVNAENSLKCALNVVGEQKPIQDQEMRNCLSSLEESFDLTCKLVRRNRDKRIETQTRIANFKDRLQEMTLELIRREVKSQITCLVSQVQNDELFRFEIVCLEKILLNAEESYRNQDFVSCNSQLETAKQNIEHSTLKSELESQESFRCLQLLHSKSLIALEAHCHYSSSESYFDKAKSLFKELMYGDSAETLLKSFESYELSTKHFSHPAFVTKYTFLLYDLVVAMFLDWISEVCIIAESAFESEITAVTLQLSTEVRSIYSSYLIGDENSESDVIPKSVWEGAGLIMQLANLVPSHYTIHGDLVELARVADHVQNCMNASSLLERTVSCLANISSRDKLQESELFVHSLDEQINRALCGIPDGVTIKYPAACRDNVKQFAGTVESCKKSLAMAEEGIHFSEQALHCSWLAAQRAFEDSEFLICLNNLTECDKSIPALEKVQRLEIQSKLDEMRTKARYFHDVSLLKQKSQDTRREMECYLQNKEFDQARKCVDIITVLKQQLADLETLQVGPDPGSAEKS